MDKDKVSINMIAVMPAMLDLLVDIHSRQLAITKVMAEQIAESTGSTFSDILRLIEAETAKIRSSCVDHIFAQYGELPAEIKNFLTRKPDDPK